MATRINTSFTSPTMTLEAEPESPMSDTPGHGLNSKSRNARAQARHRAKRKAYIEQLEASVTTLTETLNDLKQRGADEPASLRYMALEAENSQLRHENATLRQENNHFRDQLADAVRRSTPPKAPISPVDEYGLPRDTYKRRKRSSDDPYLASASVSYTSFFYRPFLPAGSSPHVHDVAPTLSILFYSSPSNRGAP